MDAGDNSIMVLEESVCDDLDESLASSRTTGTVFSPSTSPRRRLLPTAGTEEGASTSRNQNKMKLMNDMGQVRLTQKMRAKEKEVRRFLSVQRNRTLR